MTRRLVITTTALMLLASTPAFAHLNPTEHGSFSAGLSHPFSGSDHILAMVGVGLWAALLGGRAVWAVPAAFLIAMVIGFAAALAGTPLPFIEPTIAASVVILGLLALVALQVPTYVGMAVVGFFALFHGYAHGGELGEAGALPFMAGFVLATAMLHGIGVAIGLGAARFGGAFVTRLAGGLTALGGLWLFVGM